MESVTSARWARTRFAGELTDVRAVREPTADFDRLVHLFAKGDVVLVVFGHEPP